MKNFISRSPLTGVLLFTAIFSTTALNAQSVTTYAGSGTAGYSGDGSAATAANLDYPHGLGTDASGNAYITDAHNHRVRKVSATTGIISSVAGNGAYIFGGDGGPATAAGVNNPFDVAFDGSGNMYIGDIGNNRVRKVNSVGVITTIAGTSASGFSGDGGPATAAQLDGISGVLTDGAGNVYLSDGANQRIRKINTSGTITTIAGTGSAGYSGDGGPATAADIYNAGFMCFDVSGNLYLSDNGNHRVRKMNSAGIISTFAGNGSGSHSGDGGPATAAEIEYPAGICFDGAGNFYVVENAGGYVRKVGPGGTISTILSGYSTLTDIAADGSGNIYVAASAINEVLKIGFSGTLELLGPLDGSTPAFALYPNPGRGVINIQLADERVASDICITDACGRIMLHENMEGLAHQVNTTAWAPGIYTVTISLDGKAVQRKLVVE